MFSVDSEKRLDVKTICVFLLDDLTAKLTSNFGHCSQELLNLLLTGQAGTWTQGVCAVCILYL